MTDKKIKIPKHLQQETKGWCREIIEKYEMESHHLRVLTLAGESWDRKEQARLLLLEQGLTVTDKYGTMKPHPAVQIEKDSKALFLRCVRELGLDLSENEPSRPPITQPRPSSWRNNNG